MREATPFIHDLVNKLTVLYTVADSIDDGRKVDGSRFRATLGRVEELLLTLYKLVNSVQFLAYSEIQVYELNYFLVEALEKIQKIFPDVELEYTYPQDEKLNALNFMFEKTLFFQILENAIENSANAKATKIRITLHSVSGLLVFKIIDDGHGLKHHPESKSERVIPNGIGTKIIQDNTKELRGSLVYADGDDGKGVSLMLFFPCRTLPSA